MRHAFSALDKDDPVLKHWGSVWWAFTKRRLFYLVLLVIAVAGVYLIRRFAQSNLSDALPDVFLAVLFAVRLWISSGIRNEKGAKDTCVAQNDNEAELGNLRRKHIYI